MSVIHGDVFTGKIVKAYQVEKGFKGMLQLNDTLTVGLHCPYDGKVKDLLAGSVGNPVTLVGDLSFPGKDQSVPVLVVKGTLGVGQMVKRGRLTRDPELNYSPQGKAYTRFSMAVNRGFGDNQTTYFINCVLFGNEREKNAATVLAENGSKGQEILVKGRLSSNQSKNKTYYDMIVDDFEFIGKTSSRKADNDPYADYTNDYVDYSDVGIEISDEEDIPF